MAPSTDSSASRFWGGTSACSAGATAVAMLPFKRASAGAVTWVPGPFPRGVNVPNCRSERTCVRTLSPAGRMLSPALPTGRREKRCGACGSFPRPVPSGHAPIVDGSAGGPGDVALHHVVLRRCVLLADDDPGAAVDPDLTLEAGIVIRQAGLFVARKTQDDLVQ